LGLFSGSCTRPAFCFSAQFFPDPAEPLQDAVCSSGHVHLPAAQGGFAGWWWAAQRHLPGREWSCPCKMGDGKPWGWHSAARSRGCKPGSEAPVPCFWWPVAVAARVGGPAASRRRPAEEWQLQRLPGRQGMGGCLYLIPGNSTGYRALSPMLPLIFCKLILSSGQTKVVIVLQSHKLRCAPSSPPAPRPIWASKFPFLQGCRLEARGPPHPQWGKKPPGNRVLRAAGRRGQRPVRAAQVDGAAERLPASAAACGGSAEEPAALGNTGKRGNVASLSQGTVQVYNPRHVTRGSVLARQLERRRSRVSPLLRLSFTLHDRKGRLNTRARVAQAWGAHGKERARRASERPPCRGTLRGVAGGAHNTHTQLLARGPSAGIKPGGKNQK